LLASRELARVKPLSPDDLKAVKDLADYAFALGLLDVSVRERYLRFS
jgi:hypothetical protein